MRYRYVGAHSSNDKRLDFLMLKETIAAAWCSKQVCNYVDKLNKYIRSTYE